MNKILFCDFGRFPASCCLSLGHNARIAPISFFVQTFSALLHSVRNLFENAIESHWLSSCFASLCSPLCSLCSQSAPQNAIEVHGLLLFSALLHSVRNLFENAIESHWLSSCSLSCGTLSKATGFLHAAIYSKTDSKSQEINL